MDMDTADSEDIPADDPLAIDEHLPPTTSVGGLEHTAVPQSSENTCSEADPLALPLAEPPAEKRYHELEPAARRAVPDGPSLLTVKQEACLSLTLVPEPSSADSHATRDLPPRRCRRQAVETVPFKKRRRVLSPELGEDRYLLPDHVQDQVERAQQQASGRRLRPKRAAQLAASVEMDEYPPEARGADQSPSGSVRRSIKQEPGTEGEPACSGEPEPSAAPLPRKKRGRPRKSQAPQRRPPAEEAVTAPGQSVRAPQETGAPVQSVTAPQETVTAPQETVAAPQESVTALENSVTAPVHAIMAPEDSVTAPEKDKTASDGGDGGALQRPPEEELDLPRRGRKSATPSRRGRLSGQTSGPLAIILTSPSVDTPAAAAEPADDSQKEDEEDPEVGGSLVTDVSRVSCSGLPVSEPVSLSDELRLLEVPGKEHQRPCPLCGSLTGCPPPDCAEQHCHAPDTLLSPRRRLRVIVDGTAPSDDTGARRQVNLSDRDGAPVTVEVKRRGRRGRQPGGGKPPAADQKLECQLCGKVMLSISRLKKHQLVHTDERPFNCDKCPKAFKSIHVLNAHQLTHINYRPFRCQLCRQTFAKKWTLRGHMNTHDRFDGSDGLKCATCGIQFIDHSTYDSHIKIHTGERKWECKVCHRGFAKKLKLRKHMVVHSQAMLHKCTLCDREFRWKEKLVKHIMLHTGERPFKCTEPRCPKSFRAHSDLNVHLRNVHKKQPKKLEYPIVKSDPKPNHCELLLMRVNEMDGVPSCDLCTKTFSSKDEYLNHVIPAHRDQEAYVCHPCKRVFDSKPVYDDHQDERHRRGEVMWRCHLCPKIFNKRALFEGHKTLHATKCQCKICFRFASDETRLQAHILAHRYRDIDNSSHACTICSRQFKLRFSLKNHMFKMHSIDLPSLRKPPMRKFECSICHARFVRPTPAYNHMVRVHDIRPEPEVQDLFDLSQLSVVPADGAGTEGLPSLPGPDADDPTTIAALQNNIRVKVQAMAAQGMWDASEADGSAYLGGSSRRRQGGKAGAGDGTAGGAGAGGTSGRQQTSGGQAQQPLALKSAQPDPLALEASPDPLALEPSHSPPLALDTDPDPLAIDPVHPTPLVLEPIRPLSTPPHPPSTDSGRTLLHLSPGKHGQVVRVSGSPPPPGDTTQRQQIIVIQQEGEEEIDLSRVLGSTVHTDAQTLTMNADGLLVDDQGNPVSLMVEGGGTATHLLEYLRATEPITNTAAAAAASAVRPGV